MLRRETLLQREVGSTEIFYNDVPFKDWFVRLKKKSLSRLLTFFSEIPLLAGGHPAGFARTQRHPTSETHIRHGRGIH